MWDGGVGVVRRLEVDGVGGVLVESVFKVVFVVD